MNHSERAKMDCGQRESTAVDREDRQRSEGADAGVVVALVALGIAVVVLVALYWFLIYRSGGVVYTTVDADMPTLLSWVPVAYLP